MFYGATTSSTENSPSDFVFSIVETAFTVSFFYSFFCDVVIMQFCIIFSNHSIIIMLNCISIISLTIAIFNLYADLLKEDIKDITVKKLHNIMNTYVPVHIYRYM